MKDYNAITTGEFYKDLRIIAGDSKVFSFYTEILDEIYNQFKIMTSKHSKVLFIRFDLHFPQHFGIGPFNPDISKLFKNLIEFYNYKGIDLRYAWVREHSKHSHNPHYHCILLVNGNKIQNYHGVIAKILKIWSRILDYDAKGLVHYAFIDRDGNDAKNGIKIIRPSASAYGVEAAQQRSDYWFDYNKCFEWSSYLAKIDQKQHTPFSTRRFGASKILGVERQKYLDF